MILFHEMSLIGKSIETELGVTVKGYETSFGGNENVLKLTVALVAQSCVYAESHWIVYFKRANCIVCEL